MLLEVLEVVTVVLEAVLVLYRLNLGNERLCLYWTYRFLVKDHQNHHQDHQDHQNHRQDYQYHPGWSW